MATTRKIVGSYQMWWDCEHCDSKALQGVDHRFCPNCGAVQDENRRYFPPQHLAKPTKYNPVPDHECPYCGAPGSPNHNNCGGCGGPMDGSEPVAKRPTTTSMAGETVDDALEALEARKRAERAKINVFHSPESRRLRERQRAAEHEAHAEREARRREEYEQTRAEAEQRNRDLGNLWKEREGFIDDEPEWKEDFFQTHKVHIGIAAALAVFVGLIWMFFFWEKSIEAEVTATPWQRAQVIEQYKTIQDDDWCSSKPRDAYNVSRRQKIHHYETVVDCYNCDCHTERYQSGENCTPSCSTSRVDNGNGSYDVVETCRDVCTPIYDTREVCQDRTHEEPVYEPYCHYDLDRWRPHTKPTMSGGAGQTPAWPELKYNECDRVALGCERPGARSEWYKTKFKDTSEPEQYECEWPQSTWEKYPVGSRWEAIVKVVGGRFQCESLKASR